jgi:hypothetical protein
MHIAQQHKNAGLVSDNDLHVIGVVSNPARWQSRLRLARQWMAQTPSAPCVRLYMVETAYGDRHHEVVSDAPNHLKLRTTSEAWVKEPMINLAVRYLLPRDWRYVAWVDADVEFRDPNWAQETLHQLQHYAVVQPWQQCLDLGPGGNVIQMHQSFGWVQQSGKRMQQPQETAGAEAYAFGHPGFAWACTRELWEATRGLMDHCILGAADHHSAWSYAGQVEASIHGQVHAAYRRRCVEWAAQAVRITHGHVGFVSGRIEHAFHGAKKNRFYQSRWGILVKHRFNPDTDLMYDAQGLIRIVGKPALEADLRAYNRSRAEDSIDE